LFRVSFRSRVEIKSCIKVFRGVLKDLGGGQGLVKAKMHFQVIRDFGLFVKKEIKEKKYNYSYYL